MKFKVGDKVKAVDNRYLFTNKTKNFIGEVVELLDERSPIEYKDLLVRDLNASIIYRVNSKHFELVEEPTEFTFQEVIARIKPGEIYEPVNGLCITQTITMDYEKDIIIDFLPNKSFAVLTCTLFKLQEPKKKVNIYRVEHKQDGKKYDFISSQLLQEGMIVVCDTSQGKSYGRIVDIIFKELTEQEIKQYKECWRV